MSEDKFIKRATIYDDMTVADAIAVLQQFGPNAGLILQAVLPSGEVHGLPITVFQPHPHAAVGMTMRCCPSSTPGQPKDIDNATGTEGGAS